MRLLPTLLALALLLAPAEAQNQNLLIVLADDLGVDMVGAYGEGNDMPPTPTIDSLATSGVLFRNAWANPSCSPTRACTQTGRYPSRTYIGLWIDYPHDSFTRGTLNPAEVTIPEVLDMDGGTYAHGFIGKWHMSYASQGLGVPNEAGWSHYAGMLDGQVGSYTNYTQVVNGVAHNETTYLTTRQVDDAISWIQGQSEPWVCYLAFQAPHLPFHVPPANLHTQNLAGVPITTSSRPHYKALIEAMDTELGRLFTTLGTTTMANTNVVFMGDNGSVQNTAVAPFKGSKAKGSPYEGGLNVPLIFSGPAVVNPGREVADLAGAVDIFPTVLALTDALDSVPAWVELDGVDLSPYLDETVTAPVRDHIYSEQFIGSSWPAPAIDGHATIRNAQYKLIQYQTKSDLFYDLQSDPWENNNLLPYSSMTVAQKQNFDALTAQIATIRAKSPAITPFGSSSCLGSTGLVPQQVSGGIPKLGGLYSVEVQDCLPVSIAYHVLGLDTSQWLGLPLPLDLSALGGGTGCEIHVSPYQLAPHITNAIGSATHFVLVPNTPALVGMNVFHQWVALDPAAPGNGLGWVTSPPLAARLGL